MKYILNAYQIQKILPHKYPFLLLDRIVEVEPGKSITGIKCVTSNEPYFQGHFPDEPIMPGVLIIETLAQLTAIFYSFFYDGTFDVLNISNEELEGYKNSVGYLASVESFKFKYKVQPGDVIILKSIMIESFENMYKHKVVAIIDSKTVASGVIVVTKK